MKNDTRTLVVYEAPHHLSGTLKDLLEVLGDRPTAVCRELTKIHETVFLTTLSEALAYYELNDPRGEFVLVIEGRCREEITRLERERWERMSLEDHMRYYTDTGTDRKEAMKHVAKDRGISKSEVYRRLLRKEE